MKKVVSENLNKNDFYKIMSSFLILGSTRNLKIYNEAPYFVIKKFYNNDELCGLAVIFLGYNGLESSDASLEELIYWVDDYNMLNEFLTILKEQRDYRVEVTDIYYDSEKFNNISFALQECGFKSIGHKR